MNSIQHKALSVNVAAPPLPELRHFKGAIKIMFDQANGYWTLVDSDRLAGSSNGTLA